MLLIQTTLKKKVKLKYQLPYFLLNKMKMTYARKITLKSIAPHVEAPAYIGLRSCLLQSESIFRPKPAAAHKLKITTPWLHTLTAITPAPWPLANGPITMSATCLIGANLLIYSFLSYFATLGSASTFLTNTQQDSILGHPVHPSSRLFRHVGLPLINPNDPNKNS